MKSIHSATPREKEVASALRERCITEIANSDADQVCDKLGLTLTGLGRQLCRPTWDLHIAFRVADCLGLQVADELVGITQPSVSAA
jgi:hypothetical protein